MVSKPGNSITYPWVSLNDYYSVQWFFTILIEKENTIHDRTSCFVANRMSKYFYYK
jgi:hypothetical protein